MDKYLLPLVLLTLFSLNACMEELPADDFDGDGIVNSDDNCPSIANPDQVDSDADQLGDACDSAEADVDNDGISDALDNCVQISNSDQANRLGGTDFGDACEDQDGDGIVDANEASGCVTNASCGEIAITDYNAKAHAAWQQWYTEILCEYEFGCTPPVLGPGREDFSFACPGGGSVNWLKSASGEYQTFNDCSYTIQAGVYGTPNPSNDLYGISLTVNGSISADFDRSAIIEYQGSLNTSGDFHVAIFDIRIKRFGSYDADISQFNTDIPFYTDVSCSVSDCPDGTVRYDIETQGSIGPIPYTGLLGPIYPAEGVLLP